MLYVYFGNGLIQQPGAGSILGFILLENTCHILLEFGGRLAKEGA